MLILDRHTQRHYESSSTCFKTSATLIPHVPLEATKLKNFKKDTTYRHQEENDDLLVYVSPTLIETIKQSAELDDALINVPNNTPNDAPNDVSNDVPISAPTKTYGESDAPSGSDLPSPSLAPELDLTVALRKGKRTCRYLVSAFVSYDGLSTSSRAFEMNALDHNGTWDLVDLTVHKKPIGCKWVFSVKMNPDGLIDRLKARLVAKGYAQTYGIDYSKTFSPVAKISSIRWFISLAATYDWALHQLDVKNALLHVDLEEEVYMEQPSGFVAQGEYGRVCKLKKALRVVGKLNYLTITRPDIAFSVSVVSRFLIAPRTTHWDVDTQILGYLKGTPRLGILYANYGHHMAEGFTDADYAGCPNTSRSTMGYCVFVGGNLVSLKSKKQNVVSRSSSGAEYGAMAQTTSKLVWLRNLIGDIGFPQSKPMKMWCDNEAAIYIVTNPVFHERTKHAEVDCHFTREKLEDVTITTPHIRTESQLADVLTKAVLGTRINSICNNLGMINIYAQLEWEC
nr:uncharacterized mitochondrial protein AtMg00810-like [Tanacetum cinerariifolium]